MRYFYESTFANYKLAIRAHTRSTWRRRFLWHFAMWGMLVCGLCVLILRFLNEGSVYWDAIGPIAVGGLIGGGVVSPLLRQWQLRKSYRAWNGDVTDGRRVYIEIDGSQLISGIEGRSEGRYERAAILEVVEDDQALLLYVRKKVFLYFIKESVPPEAITEIHAWLGETGTKADAH